MHGNNDQDRGNKWIPSDRYEPYTGPNKETREWYRKQVQERESGKPNTQLGSSSATGANSSRSKNK